MAGEQPLAQRAGAPSSRQAFWRGPGQTARERQLVADAGQGVGQEDSPRSLPWKPGCATGRFASTAASFHDQPVPLAGLGRAGRRLSRPSSTTTGSMDAAALGKAHLHHPRRLDRADGGRRRRATHRGGKDPAAETNRHNRGRAAVRHLRALEAARRTASRAGQAPTLDDGVRHEHPPVRRSFRRSAGKRQRSSGASTVARTSPRPPWLFLDKGKRNNDRHLDTRRKKRAARAGARPSDWITPLDGLIEALDAAGVLTTRRRRHAPEAILWCDPGGEFAPLVALLRPRQPSLFTYGRYRSRRADRRPAVWLRAKVAEPCEGRPGPRGSPP